MSSILKNGHSTFLFFSTLPANRVPRRTLTELSLPKLTIQICYPNHTILYFMRASWILWHFQRQRDIIHVFPMANIPSANIPNLCNFYQWNIDTTGSIFPVQRSDNQVC